MNANSITRTKLINLSLNEDRLFLYSNVETSQSEGPRKFNRLIQCKDTNDRVCEYWNCIFHKVQVFRAARFGSFNFYYVSIPNSIFPLSAQRQTLFLSWFMIIHYLTEIPRWDLKY